MGTPAETAASPGSGNQGLIEVRVALSGDSSFRGVLVEGHAGLGKRGTDIVCAAVSVLSETLGNSLYGLLDLECVREQKSGFYEIVLESEQVCKESDLLISAFIIGIQSITEQFPDRVRLTMDRSGSETPEG